MNYLLAITILLFSKPIFSQNYHDANWVFGRGNVGCIVNLRTDTPYIESIGQMYMKTNEALVCMSDKDGHLLFYSNNCTISNHKHQLMTQGGGLNPGAITNYWCSVNPYANPYNQSIISIPHPNKENKYLLVHVDSESFNFGGVGGGYYTPKHLLVTLVDMDLNNGQGEVVYKNIPILEDTLSSAKLTGTKHANGRDWWIMVPEYKSNCYYKILISNNETLVYNKQCLGYVWNRYDESGGSLFTPNGRKFIRLNDKNGLNIYDFDRCSGELSNPIHISLAPDTNTVSSLSISPNSRFVYFNTLYKIYQFDLNASDIAASKLLVANYDGFESAGNYTDFYHARLAPNGKIYLCTYGPTYYLHTINQPDSLGEQCEVLQHNILLPCINYASIPNSLNYNLGSLDGFCDTVSVLTDELFIDSQEIDLYPNPVLEAMHIKMKDVNKYITQVNILNSLGMLIFTQKYNEPFVKIPTPSIDSPQSILFVQILDNFGKTYVKKVLKN